MLIKAGTYRFNDVLTEGVFEQDINFTLSATYEDVSFIKIYCSKMRWIIDYYGSLLAFAVYKMAGYADGEDIVEEYDPPTFLPVYNEGKWLDDIPLSLYFTITEDTEVADDFGTWYIANTEPLEKRLVEIIYRGKTIASLDAGETATLSCEGKKMASDVTVKVNSILQGATAYTVSSVDELPSNAVDGSMAIVESDSEWLGVWEFKGELTRSDDIWGNAESGYSEFSLRAKMQDGFEVRKMRFAETYDGIYTLQYFGEMEHQNLDVYRTDELWGMPKGWLDESYKTLTLLKGLDAEGIATWWKSNAIRTVAHKLKTFYIRENGEWVYKCEIVV